MLNLDLADTAIIETIATARTIMATAPNSGIMLCSYNLHFDMSSFFDWYTYLHDNYHLYLNFSCILFVLELSNSLSSYINTMKSISCPVVDNESILSLR